MKLLIIIFYFKIKQRCEDFLHKIKDLPWSNILYAIVRWWLGYSTCLMNGQDILNYYRIPQNCSHYWFVFKVVHQTTISLLLFKWKCLAWNKIFFPKWTAVLKKKFNSKIILKSKKWTVKKWLTFLLLLVGDLLKYHCEKKTMITNEIW